MLALIQPLSSRKCFPTVKPNTLSNPQPLHAVTNAFAQNQTLPYANVGILGKLATQLANFAFVHCHILHSVVVSMKPTSAILHVAPLKLKLTKENEQVPITLDACETKSLRLGSYVWKS